MISEITTNLFGETIGTVTLHPNPVTLHPTPESESWVK